MKLLRISHPNYSDHQSLINGEGARLNGGRWNHIGVPAIYTSNALQVSVAEKSFYSIVNRIHQMKNQQSRHLHRDAVIKGEEFRIAEIIVSSKVGIEDLTSNKSLSHWLNKAGLRSHTVDDGRKSPYDDLPETWTQALGTYLSGNRVKAIKVRSARSDLGEAIVLFPHALEPTDVSTGKVLPVTLAAANQNGNRAKKHDDLSTSTAWYEMENSSGIVQVLEIPV